MCKCLCSIARNHTLDRLCVLELFQGKKKGKGKGGEEADSAAASVQVRTKPCASFFNLFSEDRSLKGRRKHRGRGARRGQAGEDEEDEEEEDGGGEGFGGDEGEGVEALAGDWIPPDHLELLQAFQQEVIASFSFFSSFPQGTCTSM